VSQERFKSEPLRDHDKTGGVSAVPVTII